MLYSTTTGSHGPHIIFLHGNSQSHRVWDGVLGQDALSNVIKVAADMPGHGSSFRSDRPEVDYSMRGMAEHVAAFLAGYSEQGYIVVASSLATNYIAEKAYSLNNCKGVFLMGPCIIGESIIPAEIIMPNPNFAPTFEAEPDEAMLDALIADEAYHVSPELKAQLKSMYHDTDPQLRVQLGKSVAEQEYGDEIGNLWKQDIPIAVVYGADDKLINPDYMASLPLKMWKDKIIKIPKAGHCFQFDEPELLAKMIAEFAGECFK